MNPIAVSTWALHHWIDADFPDSPAERATPFEGVAESLLRVPAGLKEHGFDRVEVCHFHLPPDQWARADFARACEAEGVALQCLFIDAGDITDPNFHARDLAWIHGWVRVAEEMGFERARVIAGKQPWSEESFRLASTNLNLITGHARLPIVIENWFDLLQTPEHVHQLLDACEDVGLNADFGNWSGPDKYERLEKIMPRAISCHAKCDSKDGVIDEEDFNKCLAFPYSGPYTLVHGEGRQDPWEFLAAQRECIGKVSLGG